MHKSDAAGFCRCSGTRRLRSLISLATAACLHVVRGATFEAQVTSLYRPLQAEQVALSPDGRLVAYTCNERGELVIYITTVDFAQRRFRIIVADDRETPFTKERTPARLRFLGWTSPNRLIFAPTPDFRDGQRVVAPIQAVDANGTNPKILAEADDFSDGPRRRSTTIVGFMPGNRGVLLVEARGSSRSPTALISVEIATGIKTTLSEETIDGRFLYDHTGRARIIYTNPKFVPTRSFLYESGGTWGRWVTMDEKWGGPLVRTFAVTAENYYGERSFPLGFDVDPNVFYYASNVGRDTYGIYAFDVRTKQRTGFAVEDSHVDLAPLEPSSTDRTLVFDDLSGHLVGVRAVGVTPFTHWLDPELAALQAELERKFPQRTVEICQWDDARRRFLLRVTGGIEPGRYHVWQRPENVMVEVISAAPWLHNADLNAGTTFEFDTPRGVHLSGYLTFPQKPRLTPPPLLIDFSDGLMGRVQPGFDREAQVLAGMGCVVARLNHRGASGFGIKYRRAIQTGADRVPVDDALAALDWIAQRHPIDRKRVVVIGRGWGGYLALRALQLEPAAFRAAIAVDAPLDPEAWLQPKFYDLRGGLDVTQSIQFTPGSDRPSAAPLGGPRPPPVNFTHEAQRAFLNPGAQRLSALSVLHAVDLLTKPVMLVVDDQRDRTILAQNFTLQSQLKGLGRTPVFLETDEGVARDLPGARAKLFRKVEEFINLNVYDFNVKIGPTKEVK